MVIIENGYHLYWLSLIMVITHNVYGDHRWHHCVPGVVGQMTILQSEPPGDVICNQFKMKIWSAINSKWNHKEENMKSHSRKSCLRLTCAHYLDPDTPVATVTSTVRSNHNSNHYHFGRAPSPNHTWKKRVMWRRRFFWQKKMAENLA